MSNLISYEPFVDTGIDELFRGFFKPVRFEGTKTPVTIKMDVTETDKGYLIHAEMPGVKKDDINVDIDGNQVTITAEMKRETERKEGDKVLRSERYYGNVYRSFTLPRELDESMSEAKFADGVLELTLVPRLPVAGKKLMVK
jgi:HSP20 family protein